MKPSFACPPYLRYRSSAAWRSGKAFSVGCRSTGIFSGPESDSGFLLLAQIPLLILGLILLLGTLRVVAKTQARIALQSRLDICAVRLIEDRKAFAKETATGNQVIHATAMAVAASRGIKILTGPAGLVLGGVTEAVLVKANRGMAAWQNARLVMFQAKETLNLACTKTPYSRELAWCRMKPALGKAVERRRALFPDLYGPLVFRGAPLGRAECFGGLTARVSTEMTLTGDPSLVSTKFMDTYE